MRHDRRSRLIAALHNAAPLLLDVVEAAKAVERESPLLDIVCVVDPKKIDALRVALEALHAAALAKGEE